MCVSVCIDVLCVLLVNNLILGINLKNWYCVCISFFLYYFLGIYWLSKLKYFCVEGILEVWFLNLLKCKV